MTSIEIGVFLVVVTKSSMAAGRGRTSTVTTAVSHSSKLSHISYSKVSVPTNSGSGM